MEDVQEVIHARAQRDQNHKPFLWFLPLNIFIEKMGTSVITTEVDTEQH